MNFEHNCIRKNGTDAVWYCAGTDTYTGGYNTLDGGTSWAYLISAKDTDQFTTITWREFWDFVEIWNIGGNQTCLYLWVYPAGDLNHDGRVDFFDFAIAASHWCEGVEDD